MIKSFNIYSFGLNVESSDFDLNRFEMLRDFKHFEKDAVVLHAEIKINKLASLEAKRTGWPLFATRSCRVRQITLSQRRLTYEFGADQKAEVFDESAGQVRSINLYVENREFADDILYFMINSICGEYLEFYGKMRLHAVGFSRDGKGELVFGIPGSGKSTLALQMLQKSNYSLFADEICLYDLNSKMLLPFPLPIGASESEQARRKFNFLFSGKHLTEIPEARVALPAPLSRISFFSEGALIGRLKLFAQILIGTGLIQMAEYLIRFNNPDVLLTILRNRVKLIMHLIRFRIHFIPQSKESLQKLEDFEKSRND